VVGGGSIHPSRRGKGHRPLGWSRDRQPLHGPMFLFALPAPLKAVTKVIDETARLHSVLRLGFCDGGVAYRFHVSFVPPPVRSGIPIVRGLTYIEARISSKALRLEL
jgi:hypothetical protein